MNLFLRDDPLNLQRMLGLMSLALFDLLFLRGRSLCVFFDVDLVRSRWNLNIRALSRLVRQLGLPTLGLRRLYLMLCSPWSLHFVLLRILLRGAIQICFILIARSWRRARRSRRTGRLPLRDLKILLPQLGLFICISQIVPLSIEIQFRVKLLGRLLPCLPPPCSVRPLLVVRYRLLGHPLILCLLLPIPGSCSVVLFPVPPQHFADVLVVLLLDGRQPIIYGHHFLNLRQLPLHLRGPRQVRGGALLGRPPHAGFGDAPLGRRRLP